MRLIIPKEISDMSRKVFPYLQLVEGQGLVLKPDAPSDIVQMRETVLQWFADNKKYN